MPIENIMYFALGLLIAGLVALMIMPAVWRRAVRLTKKRIEAATPITMAEFRADKDQLRAEFALSTRRLEMNVEALRKRLAEQLRDINRKKTELGGIKGERDSHLTVVRELEEREAELRRRIVDLEKESADLASKLKMRDREYADKVAQLEAARDELRENTPRSSDEEVESLRQQLEVEQKRASFLEAQNRTLISQLESSDRRTASATTVAAELRASLAKKDDTETDAKSELIEAEARMADAESRVNALLEETSRQVEIGEKQNATLLAEKLSLEEEVEHLRVKVLTVESTVMADWDTDRIEQSHLREKLNDIASDVSRLVYAVEGHGLPDREESLFDRVQRFADDGMKIEEFPVRAALQQKNGRDNGVVSDRLSALREMQQEPK